MSGWCESLFRELTQHLSLSQTNYRGCQGFDISANDRVPYVIPFFGRSNQGKTSRIHEKKAADALSTLLASLEIPETTKMKLRAETAGLLSHPFAVKAFSQLRHRVHFEEVSKLRALLAWRDTQEIHGLIRAAAAFVFRDLRIWE